MQWRWCDTLRGVNVRTAAFADLDPLTAYAIWRLRVDVFVVEQECAYPELDGRDAEPTTQHWWVPGDADGEAPVAAYLRVLATPDPHEARIGRVVTAPAHRGRGLAATLMRDTLGALRETGVRSVVLDAQSHLSDWYAALGFDIVGPEFLEDGIPHVPMRQELAAP